MTETEKYVNAESFSGNSAVLNCSMCEHRKQEGSSMYRPDTRQNANKGRLHNEHAKDGNTF